MMTPVSRVAGSLWQGGYQAPKYMSQRVHLHIHCAYEVPSEGPRADHELYIPLDDAQVRWKVDPRWREQVVSTALQATDALAEGRMVLTTCHMGLNRSGLISALALVFGGLSSREAVRLIRRARGPNALTNTSFQEFVEYIHQRVAARVRVK